MRSRRALGKTSLLVAAAGVAILLASAGTAASAQSDTDFTLQGMTRSEFIRQATSEGVAPAVAAKAWGNRDAMSKLPVSSTLTIETSSGYAATTVSDVISGPASAGAKSTSGVGAPTTMAAAADTWTHWSTCTKTSKNWLGGTIRKLQMDKQWTSVGTTVSAPAVQTYGSGGWTWSFDGIVNTNDFYSTANNNSHGAHTSYRQGKYTSGGEGANEWVQVKGTYNTSTCTKS